MKPLYLLFTLVFMIACRHDEQPQLCKLKSESFSLPGSLYNWFNQVAANDSGKVMLQCKSDKGASEIISVDKSRFKYNAWINDCHQQFFEGYRCSYMSANHAFRAEISGEFQYYPGGPEFSTIQQHENIDPANINLSFYVPLLNRNIQYSSQVLLPVRSDQLKVNYHTEQAYPPKSSFTYDKCISDIGQYIQNGKTFTDVTRYTIPAEANESSRYTEFLFDKTYGVIGFTETDGTKWAIEGF